MSDNKPNENSNLAVITSTIIIVIQLLPPKSRVIRVMPNTPAVVRAAASAFSMGTACKEGDAEIVKDLLSTVGYVVQVPEALMDPITGLSGSGPAYVSYT